jgi:hypothetical protein
VALSSTHCKGRWMTALGVLHRAGDISSRPNHGRWSTTNPPNAGTSCRPSLDRLRSFIDDWR